MHFYRKIKIHTRIKLHLLSYVARLLYHFHGRLSSSKMKLWRMNIKWNYEEWTNSRAWTLRHVGLRQDGACRSLYERKPIIKSLRDFRRAGVPALYQQKTSQRFAHIIPGGSNCLWGIWTQISGLFLAGAEGLEPSARGFGVDVRHSKSPLVHGIYWAFCASSQQNPVPFDAILMLLKNHSEKRSEFDTEKRTVLKKRLIPHSLWYNFSVFC